MNERPMLSLQSKGALSNRIEMPIPPHLEFKIKLDRVLDRLTDFESNHIQKSGKRKKQIVHKSVDSLRIEMGLDKSRRKETLTMAEDQIFVNIFKLFEMKYNGEKSKKKPKGSLNIGALACLGAGKTTITRALERKLKEAGENVEFKEEKHLTNPFWSFSQKDKKYMLRSQAYFFTTNILAMLNDRDPSKINPKITLSDTSVLTDIFIWAMWYRDVGKFSIEEFESYWKLVQLVKPVVPKPDLMLIFGPEFKKQEVIENYVKRLRRGIRKRLENDKRRIQEKVFTRNNKALRRQLSLVNISAVSLQTLWDIAVYQIDVDPLMIFKDKGYLNGIIEQIETAIANYDKLKAQADLFYQTNLKK